MPDPEGLTGFLTECRFPRFRVWPDCRNAGAGAQRLKPVLDFVFSFWLC